MGEWAVPCCRGKHCPQSRSMHGTIVEGGLCKRGACSEWASGLSLAAKQSIDMGSRNMDMGVLQVALFCRRDVQSGQVGVPLLLNKALKWGQETWIWAFYKWHSFEEGMFRVGQWAVPCCRTKHCPQSRSKHWAIVEGGLCKRGACSEWASGLSLAPEQSIEVGLRNMNIGFLQVALF